MKRNISNTVPVNKHIKLDDEEEEEEKKEEKIVKKKIVGNVNDKVKRTKTLSASVGVGAGTSNWQLLINEGKIKAHANAIGSVSHNDSKNEKKIVKEKDAIDKKNDEKNDDDDDNDADKVIVFDDNVNNNKIGYDKEKRGKISMPITKNLTKYIALDAEFVGVGATGQESVLAHIAITNFDGHVILDTFVAPPAHDKITDYRTKYSGVRAEDLKNAPSFERIQKIVADIVKDRIVVGHALKNDWKALLLNHSFQMTRDTSLYPPLRRGKGKPAALRVLTQKHLGVSIQSDEHSPVEDARSAMSIYRLHQNEWEKYMKMKANK